MNNKKLYTVHLLAATSLLLYTIYILIGMLEWESEQAALIFFFTGPSIVSLLILLTEHILMHKTDYSKKQRVLLYILCILGFVLLSVLFFFFFALITCLGGCR